MTKLLTDHQRKRLQDARETLIGLAQESTMPATASTAATCIGEILDEDDELREDEEAPW